MTAQTPRSCATCGVSECRLSHVRRGVEPLPERTSFVLDEAWPEHRALVRETAGPADQVLIPGVPGARIDRYGWGLGSPVASRATLLRHIAMRRVASARGAVRQAAYCAADERLAKAMGRRLDFRARHVVVSQTLLPFLWRQGLLGGRSFDVLLTRFPMADLHARLDHFANAHPTSSTLDDFRAPDGLVRAEADALAEARQVITPHHYLARTFGQRGRRLEWERPQPRPRRPGTRVAFLGPTIARQGAYEVRDIAADLTQPLIVFGSDLEGPDFWKGVEIERRRMDARWLDDLGVILHPAAMTSAPRRLIEAVTHGVRVYALETCGLAPSDWRPFSTYPLSGSALREPDNGPALPVRA